jgi:hypothetical protein
MVLKIFLSPLSIYNNCLYFRCFTLFADMHTRQIGYVQLYILNWSF